MRGIELIDRPSPAVVEVTGGTDLRAWREEQKAYRPGAEYSDKHVSNGGWWDGYIQPGEADYHGGKVWTMRFGRGLLPELIAAFPDAPRNREFARPDVGWPGPLQQYDPDGLLRDYQVESLHLIFLERWGRIALATNAGKGAIIGIAAATAADAGIPALILSDEIAVFNALHEEIEKWAGVDPYLVEAGCEEPPPAQGVTLAMVPTLHRRLTDHDRQEEWNEWAEGVGMALLDEADRATADTWQEICDRLKNTHYRVGFSGSFDAAAEQSELDELVMRESLGPVLTEVKNVDLVERGISARPTVELHRFMQNFDQLPPPKEWFGWTGPERRRWAYEEGVVYNDRRHRLIRDELIDPDVPNCIIVERIDHGKELARFLDSARFLYGEHSKSEREHRLQAFRNESFRTLIATRIFDRGTNRLGTVVNLIFASGQGSKVQTLQRTGRGLRKEDGKEFLRLLDVVDSPPPGHDRNVDPYQYFVNSVRKRISLYNQEDFEVEIVDHAR